MSPISLIGAMLLLLVCLTLGIKDHRLMTRNTQLADHDLDKVRLAKIVKHDKSFRRQVEKIVGDLDEQLENS